MIAAGSLTPEQVHLVGLLVDTDLTVERLAARLGVPAWKVRRRTGDVFSALGVVSRPHLRSVLLECELAAVGT